MLRKQQKTLRGYFFAAPCSVHVADAKRKRLDLIFYWFPYSNIGLCQKVRCTLMCSSQKILLLELSVQNYVNHFLKILAATAMRFTNRVYKSLITFNFFIKLCRKTREQ